MKGPGAEEAEHRSGFRPARWIVAAQVALSLVLLLAAGLFVQSFWKLASLDVGFDRKNVLLVGANIHNANVPDAQRAVVWESILSQLRAIPGAISVSQSWMTPISHWAILRSVFPRSPNSPTGAGALVYANFVSPGFCETLHIPLLSGRDFTSSDTAKNQSVAIINETMALKFFPGEDPIGKYFASELGQSQIQSRVVGVVNDSKYLLLCEDFHPTAYFPAAQMDPIPESWNFEIRTALEPSAMEKSAEAAVLSVNNAISLEFSILEQQLDDSGRGALPKAQLANDLMTQKSLPLRHRERLPAGEAASRSGSGNSPPRGSKPKSLPRNPPSPPSSWVSEKNWPRNNSRRGRCRESASRGAAGPPRTAARAVRAKEEPARCAACRAGLSGVLSAVSVEIGQQVTPGTNLVRVADPSHLKATVQIPETQAKDVSIGQKARSTRTTAWPRAM